MTRERASEECSASQARDSGGMTIKVALWLCFDFKHTKPHPRQSA